MRTRKIYYEKKFNTNNNESEVIGIEIELDTYDNEDVAFTHAQEFVEHSRKIELTTKEDIPELIKEKPKVKEPEDDLPF